MKLQLDIPKEINKQLKIYKAKNDIGSITDAVNKILEEKFEKGHEEVELASNFIEA